MNAQDKIQQQDNELLEQRVAAVDRALAGVVAAVNAYERHGGKVQAATLDAAQSAYQKALMEWATTMMAMWRAGYRLTR